MNHAFAICEHGLAAVARALPAEPAATTPPRARRAALQLAPATLTLLAGFAEAGDGAEGYAPIAPDALWQRLETETPDARVSGQFVLIQADARTLRIAVDPIGWGALYWLEAAPETVAVSTDFWSLLAFLPDSEREVDREALFETLWYRGVFGGKTLLRRIRQAQAGERRIWTRGGGSREQPPPPFRYRAVRRPRGQNAERLDTLLRTEALTLADHGRHPALLLSGGVDSGLLCGLLAAREARNATAFTVRFRGARTDETPAAIRIAQRFGMRQELIELAPEQVFDAQRQVARVYPAPPYHPGAGHDLLTYQAIAAAGADTLLTGDYADALFGPVLLYTVQNYQRLQRIPAPLHGATLAIVRALAPDKARALEQVARDFDQLTPHDFVLHVNAAWRLAASRELVPDAEPTDLRRIAEGFRSASLADWASTHAAYTADAFYARRLFALAEPLGVRGLLPFARPTVTEFAARLPFRQRRHRGINKALLKDVAARYLPADIVHARKSGFFTSDFHRLRQQDARWNDALHDLHNPQARIRNHLDQGALDRMIREALTSDHTGHMGLIWRLTTLEWWLERLARGSDRQFAPPASTAADERLLAPGHLSGMDT
ncbi:asparagine synthase-related protein [Spiribacter halobius]|uniref:asparagine synthase (glutamine-hydrolyzing) n=1 Tax=Sediminicurvatus halobius TaxID=2182432 RepID=A0A2U2MXN2_9GAMM|nr:asparagine synthase-related protein [Spiribacter halobius]PWG61696.1 hypothetical protein DEM34_15155 [Spiribacter halobius]UEX77320.1 hypothetical protein LMH63_15430 [Spiribacter halobius]